jgi:hypothetical protein
MQTITLTVIQDKQTSINNVNFSELTLYPNPATTSFRVSTTFDKLSIYSTAGQLVNSFTDNNSDIDVSKLKSGVYVVIIEYNRNIISKRLVIRN